MYSLLRHRASLVRSKLQGIQAPADNPFATHLPVLAALARVHNVRRVLELGSGPFSTSLFLNPVVFPKLEELTSFEDDPAWAATVAETIGDDDRFSLRTVGSVPASVPSVLAQYDLIFIDDSQSTKDRAKTIRVIRDMRPTKAIVVIHDYERHIYQSATRGFDQRFTFDNYTPQVGVCWFGDATSHASLGKARERISVGVDRLSLTDVDAWSKELSSLTPA